MFLTEDISSLILESCLLYDYEDVLNYIMDFAFDLLKVYVINFENRLTLVTSVIVTPKDIFEFLKAYHGMESHQARMPHRILVVVIITLRNVCSKSLDSEC